MYSVKTLLLSYYQLSANVNSYTLFNMGITTPIIPKHFPIFVGEEISKDLCSTDF